MADGLELAVHQAHEEAAVVGELLLNHWHWCPGIDPDMPAIPAAENESHLRVSFGIRGRCRFRVAPARWGLALNGSSTRPPRELEMTTADAEAYALGVAFFRLLVFLGLCGLVGALIGSKKGEPGLGFIWGVFLGPIGILVVVLSDGNRRPCRFCQEKIHKAAVVCPRCQREGPFPLAAAVPTATPRISPAVGGFVVILLFLLGVVLLMP